VEKKKNNPLNRQRKKVVEHGPTVGGPVRLGKYPHDLVVTKVTLPGIGKK